MERSGFISEISHLSLTSPARPDTPAVHNIFRRYRHMERKRSHVEISRRRWYPIFIRSARDIERLNELFAKRWFLDNLGLEEMPFLAFNAPLPDPDEPAAGAPRNAPPAETDEVLLLVLMRGKVKGRQRGMLLEPDADGYRDMRTIADRISAEGGGWKLFTVIGMERRNMLVILERKQGVGG